MPKVRFPHLLALGIAAIYLGSCARASVMPLAADTIQITASAAPVCGASGAQAVAVHRAAVETIRHGFDRFIVLGAQAENNVHMAVLPPNQATTYGSGTVTANPYTNTASYQGSSTTTYSGGGPIVFGSHDQSVVIKMFRDGDPAGQNAVPARATLGDKWQEEVAGNDRTCF